MRRKEAARENRPTGRLAIRADFEVRRFLLPRDRAVRFPRFRLPQQLRPTYPYSPIPLERVRAGVLALPPQNNFKKTTHFTISRFHVHVLVSPSRYSMPSLGGSPVGIGLFDSFCTLFGRPATLREYISSYVLISKIDLVSASFPSRFRRTALRPLPRDLTVVTPVVPEPSDPDLTRI